MARLNRKWGFARPPIGAAIQSGHPLAQNLTFFGVDQSNGVYYDHVSGFYRYALSPTGFHTSAAGGRMDGTRFNNAAGTSNGWNFGNLAAVDPTKPCTILFWINATNVAQAIAAKFSGATSNDGFIFDYNSAANVMRMYSGLATLTLNVTVLNNQLSQVVYTFDTTAPSGVAYVNGVRGASGSLNAPTGTASSLFIGAHGNATAGLQGIVPVFAFWKRMLAPSEIAALYAEPYAVVMPPTPRLFIIGGSSSAIKTVDSLAKASVKTVDGLAIASVKKVDSLA